MIIYQNGGIQTKQNKVQVYKSWYPAINNNNMAAEKTNEGESTLVTKLVSWNNIVL